MIEGLLLAHSLRDVTLLYCAIIMRHNSPACPLPAVGNWKYNVYNLLAVL